VTGLCSVQVLPFQVQVSLSPVPLPLPPKRTTWPLATSYAIVASSLAEGPPDKLGSAQVGNCVTCANRRGEAPATIPRKAISASRARKEDTRRTTNTRRTPESDTGNSKINLKTGNAGQTTAPQCHPETLCAQHAERQTTAANIQTEAIDYPGAGSTDDGTDRSQIMLETQPQRPGAGRYGSGSDGRAARPQARQRSGQSKQGHRDSGRKLWN